MVDNSQQNLAAGIEAEENQPTVVKEDGEAEVEVQETQPLPPEVEEELCSLFHCTPGSLRAVLSTVHENPKELLTLLKSLSPSYVAIKVRFDSHKRGEAGGAFCLLCRGTSGEIFDETYWASSKGIPEGFEINASWESVRKAIIDLRGPDLRAHFEKVLWNKLRGAVRDILSPTQVNLLFSSESPGAQVIEKLQEKLKEVFRTDLDFVVVFERFNKARLELSGLSEGDERVPQKEDNSLSTEYIKERGIFIPCSSIVDPVRGEAASELTAGDRIWVSFDDTGLSGFIKRTLQQTGELSVFPVQSVEKLPSGLVLVRVSISEGIYGQIRLSGDIKVKVEESGIRIRKNLFSRKIILMIPLALFIFWLFYLLLR